MNLSNLSVRTTLRQRARCPHCWEQFAPEDSMWIAAHQELTGDPRIGEEAALRFLPSRFSVEGKAIDAKGLVCDEIACPECHLQIPRGVLELTPFFISIAGTPSCGKSYFLASMTWQLRQSMPRDFGMAFTDADTLCNQILNNYEEVQFFNSDQDALIKLSKTHEHGEWYSHVLYENQMVTLPKPFLFSARPQDGHPSFAFESRIARLISLYDNAGESFEPGKDTVINPVTRHLAIADCWMFCFDPTQDPRLRQACSDKTDDLQITEGTVTARQETYFHEMVSRIRKHGNYTQSNRTDKPLIILCTKYDAWCSLIGRERLDPPWHEVENTRVKRVDMPMIERVSNEIKSLFEQHSPELISSAESLSNCVYFIPVSATGCAPTPIPDSDQLGIRPRDMNPMWCDVPLLVALIERARALMPYVKGRPLKLSSQQDNDPGRKNGSQNN